MTIVPAMVLSAVVTVGLVARLHPPRLAVERFPGPTRFAVAILLLVTVLGLTVFSPLEGLFADAVAPDPDELPFFSLFAGHAVLGGFLVLWWALAGFESPARFLRLSLDRPGRRLAAGLKAGLAAWMITMAAMVIAVSALALVRLALGLGGELAEAEATGAVTEVPEIVSFIVNLAPWRRLLLVLSAGIFEEAFFRSFLQTRGGLVLSTVLFTMSHASYGLPFMLVGVFTVSLVLGLVFRAWDDVLPCMVAHSVFDAVQLFVVLPWVVSAA